MKPYFGAGREHAKSTPKTGNTPFFCKLRLLHLRLCQLFKATDVLVSLRIDRLAETGSEGESALLNSAIDDALQCCFPGIYSLSSLADRGSSQMIALLL